ncbi:two-component sensor histidine kinase [Altererythrobacter salegens]|uniref:histidine kinase n=1 Tax=Croceibacterium salegens TaxID=1737568 RepID=A0A6I4SY69_9SPHN|nr:ATP-binding protein [Croceibacterium salegens]MXO60783.1 two-component sensor histidine kinase [Croceibacterium salegens]
MRRFLPKSLHGQMLLAVAVALLVAQAISAVLIYRAQEARREFGAANGLAFQLVAQPRIDYRSSDVPGPLGERGRMWRRLRLEDTTSSPLHAGEQRSKQREDLLRQILEEQGVAIGELVVTSRPVHSDPFVVARLQERSRWRSDEDWKNGDLIVAGLRKPGDNHWLVARVPVPRPDPRGIGSVIMQTLLLYVVLVGGLGILLRRITRPLAALTRRLETFAERRETDGQLEPSGPEDTRRLIAAHNAMEASIAALLDEKDVMLGAIGHDLKTPLAALRVRIESVPDEAERDRMARTIEDITGTLDDILSLARVGRPSDPLEQTDLGALAADVVGEFEDMDEPVELVDGPRVAAPVRATWLRRAMRNLIGNAVRYGEKAKVSLMQNGDIAVIRIDDVGPGIPADEIASMLEPFKRGEASRNRTTGGAGLGLTIARAIAEQHGGQLVLKNRPTGGLRAELRLPTKR